MGTLVVNRFPASVPRIHEQLLMAVEADDVPALSLTSEVLFILAGAVGAAMLSASFDWHVLRLEWQRRSRR